MTWAWEMPSCSELRIHSCVLVDKAHTRNTPSEECCHLPSCRFYLLMHCFLFLQQQQLKSRKLFVCVRISYVTQLLRGKIWMNVMSWWWWWYLALRCAQFSTDDDVMRFLNSVLPAPEEQTILYHVADIFHYNTHFILEQWSVTTTMCIKK